MHLSFASLVCRSRSLHLTCSFYLHLSIAPIACTSPLHINWHITLIHLAYTSPLHFRLQIPLTPLACTSHVTCNLHLSFALRTDLSHAAFICNPRCHLLFESLVSTFRPQSSFASLMCTSQLCLPCAAPSCTSLSGFSFALNFYQLSRAACMCTSHSSLSFAILGCPSQ